jgi:hypothetical protein
MDGQMSSVYQSPGDKMRYEILVKSLIEGRLNLAVLSESDLTLDFYANAAGNSRHQLFNNGPRGR